MSLLLRCPMPSQVTVALLLRCPMPSQATLALPLLDQMRADNLEKDKKIAILENRVADLEQYTRINDVIITGLSIKLRSYARAVTPENGGEPAELDVTSTE
ncbi:hypothetical protein AAFF_G00382430 [Aldrovandia affinis]|uniref:Uncharacterized protein n=1 Tax=Aldrovandia affinis TaxID=143900 RepID=A0AAD7T8B1_9TELE|nr:hypothetical protein AAFF_G00382430 [Aldrovandia affinis]